MHVYDYVIGVGYDIVTRSLDVMLHELDCACCVWKSHGMARKEALVPHKNHWNLLVMMKFALPPPCQH